MQFNFFDKDWINIDDFIFNNIESIPINLNTSFVSSIKFDKESLKQYRIQSAKHLSKYLGDKIALCLSGGIDSQCMVQCFLEANIPFDLYTLKFNKNLNEHDICTAYEYADKHNLKLNLIELDIIKFLTLENLSYGQKYKSCSPQFNAHYKFFNMLKDKGYTGICAGGFVPIRSNKEWGINYIYNSMNFINYCAEEKIYAHGNFLSFYPELTWAIALLTPGKTDYSKNTPWNGAYDNSEHGNMLRYYDKATGYKKAGFDLILQSNKLTGFEEVKKYYENITGDGWTFEKRFRFPLNNLFSYKTKPKFIIDPEVLELLNSINDNNTVPSL